MNAFLFKCLLGSLSNSIFPLELRPRHQVLLNPSVSSTLNSYFTARLPTLEVRQRLLYPS